jgi:four helix bundle protein
MILLNSQFAIHNSQLRIAKRLLVKDKIELLLSISLMNNYIPITDRTEQFAIRIVKACHYLYEQNGVSKVLANQLLRSGTSIGANVHEAQSAQSNRDFIHKLEIALKEARETEYWLNILIKSETVKGSLFQSLLEESQELNRILITSTDKLKKKL